MQSDGSNPNNSKYESFWRSQIESHSAEIIPINTSLRGSAVETESNNIKNSDALILTGGNAFQFLAQLKESGLDTSIVKYEVEHELIIREYEQKRGRNVKRLRNEDLLILY